MLQLQRALTADTAARTADRGGTDKDIGAVPARGETGLTTVEEGFAGQLATAVWIGSLSDGAAREALLSYAIARGICDETGLLGLRAALLAEYSHCRERQDLVS